MTVDKYYAWDKKNAVRYEKNPKGMTTTEGGVFFWEKTEYLAEKKAYETVIDLALKEYALSTDGVVKAMRFDASQEKFMAKVIYVDTHDQVQENVMHVTNEWVLDTYGETLMKKLMDRAQNNQFLLPPTNQQGSLATVKINDDKVVWLKYLPEKTKR